MSEKISLDSSESTYKTLPTNLHRRNTYLLFSKDAITHKKDSLHYAYHKFRGVSMSQKII